MMPAAARLLRLLVIAASIVSGCANDGGVSPAGTASPSPGASPDRSAEGSATAAPGEGEFVNPVIDANFADPFLLRVGDTYYAYATGNLTYNIQVTTSRDLVTWERIREALPRLPLWQPSSKGLTWAPEVIETDAGFVMHYTGRLVQEGRQCLAVAVAEAPEGPFVDDSREPLLCQLDLGGSIDSTPFRDEDGRLWLVWKNDGNCCGLRTRFYLQEMTPDGTGLVGEPTDLGVQNDQPWERHVIEAPTLLRYDGTYYLFYSANDYNSRNYAVGYATSEVLEGPYVDAEENPILASAGSAAGPGHQSIVADDDGELWMAYHAWDSKLVGDFVGGRRALWLDELVFEDGRPVVKGPDEVPQPIP